jgi:hypothetical protein
MNEFVWKGSSICPNVSSSKITEYISALCLLFTRLTTWWEYAPLKRRKTTRLCNVTSHKTAFFSGKSIMIVIQLKIKIEHRKKSARVFNNTWNLCSILDGTFFLKVICYIPNLNGVYTLLLQINIDLCRGNNTTQNYTLFFLVLH